MQTTGVKKSRTTMDFSADNTAIIEKLRKMYMVKFGTPISAAGMVAMLIKAGNEKLERDFT